MTTNPLEAIFRAWAMSAKPSCVEEVDIDSWWQSFSEMVKKRYPFPHSGEVTDRIFAERCRQQEIEGWTPEYDDYHTGGELAQAASSYALWSSKSDAYREYYADDRPVNWPEAWDEEWFKPSDRIRELEKAGALIVAEIERLERAALSAATPERQSTPVIDLDNPTTFTVGEVSWQGPTSEPDRRAPLGAADRDPNYVKAAIGTDRVSRPAPFGPVGSGHITSTDDRRMRGNTASTSTEHEVPGVKSANRNLEAVPESVYAPDPTSGDTGAISITEEQFRKWVSGLGINDFTGPMETLWQSFKEAAGWPRY